jgi:uncharacterized membrane protein (TIGR02234 family)
MKQQMRERLASRGGYAVTILVGLAASGVCALGVARPWARATATVHGLPPIQASVDGADVAPVAAALAVVCLAGFGAVLATRGWVRRAIGILIAACAATVVVVAAVPSSTTGLLEDALSARGWTAGGYDRTVTVWRLAVVVAGIIVVLAGVVVARFAGEWATMGTRYDSPSESRQSTPKGVDEPMSEAAMWRALDDGGDPTNGA